MKKVISSIVDGEIRRITLDHNRLRYLFENGVDGFLRYKRSSWRYLKYLDTLEDHLSEKHLVYFTPYMDLEYLVLRSIIFKSIRSIHHLKIDAKKKIDFLYRQLKIAVKEENYELAAKIRDKIRSLKGESKE